MAEVHNERWKDGFIWLLVVSAVVFICAYTGMKSHYNSELRKQADISIQNEANLAEDTAYFIGTSKGHIDCSVFKAQINIDACEEHNDLH